MRRTMRKTRKCLWKKKRGTTATKVAVVAPAMLGGAALPAPYFAAAGLTQPDAAAGKDVLTLQPGGAVIRSGLPIQGYAVKGGFVPSVGEPFVTAAAKYITPLALFAGYKLMNKGKKATRRKATRRRR